MQSGMGSDRIDVTGETSRERVGIAVLADAKVGHYLMSTR